MTVSCRELLLVSILVGAPLSHGACVTQLFPANVGGTVGVRCSSGCPPSAAIGGAIGQWNDCEEAGSGAPMLVNNSAGSAFDIQIRLSNQIPNLGGGGCAVFQPTINSSTGQVNGGTIVVYERRADGSSCSPYEGTIAHELGHVLGLDESTCNDTHIMSPRPATSTTDPRYVHADECTAVAEGWTTPAEEGNGGGGDGDDGPDDNQCNENCSPLVLDLGDDGIRTSGLDDPVSFDIDGDGTLDRVTWLARGGDDAFLWIDIDRNHLVTNGRELLGNGTLLPSGERARDGFEALRVYDRVENGGNGDGVISVLDHIWGRLRLWSDRNHDGVSGPHEVQPIQASRVISLGLAHMIDTNPDENGNVHLLRGTYFRRELGAGDRVTTRALEDIYFQVN